MAFFPNLTGSTGLKTKSFVQRLKEEDAVALSKEAADGADILKRVTAAQPAAKAAAKAQAVAVVARTKAGLGLGLQFGSGFVVCRLGAGQWSAPCFLHKTSLSAGLTIGVSETESVIAIQDQEALHKFVGAHVELGTEAMVAANLDPKAEPASKTTDDATVWGEGKGQVAHYTLAAGGGVDFSLQGGMSSPDSEKNRRFFGEDVKPEALLSGEVPAPEEFQPVYELLAKLEAEA